MDHFEYYTTLGDVQLDGYVAWITDDITNPEDLLSELHSALQFPTYDGKNWNALYDLLCDLGWIQEKKVAIVHANIPDLSSKELKIYLTILRDAVLGWHNYARKNNKEEILFPQHVLVVFFPTANRFTIKALLEEGELN